MMAPGGCVFQTDLRTELVNSWQVNLIYTGNYSPSCTYRPTGSASNDVGDKSVKNVHIY